MSGLDPAAPDFQASGGGEGIGSVGMAAGPTIAGQAGQLVLASDATDPAPGSCESDFRGRPIDFNRYQLVGLKVESDSSSRIYVIWDNDRQKDRALKTINSYNRKLKTFWNDKSQKARVKHEIRMHHQVNDHRNVCTLNAVFQCDPVGHLVMELCHIDLYELVMLTRQELRRFNIKKLFLDIIDGVTHCHRKNVALRNLNPRNIGIIFDEVHGEDDAVLLDFGEAITPLNSSALVHNDFDGYAAPEMERVRMAEPVTCNWAAGDIWSLGIILFFMCTADKPFNDRFFSWGSYQQYRQGQSLQHRFKAISAELEAILRVIFVHQPSDRIALGDLRLKILNCDNFFSWEDRNYPHFTGWPSRRDQHLIQNQRPDQRDDVHDDFYAEVLSDPPLALPAPQFQSALPVHQIKPLDLRSTPLKPPEDDEGESTDGETEDQAMAVQREIVQQVAAAHEAADRFLEARRTTNVLYPTTAPRTSGSQTTDPQSTGPQTPAPQITAPQATVPQSSAPQIMASEPGTPQNTTSQPLAGSSQNPQAQLTGGPRPQPLPTWGRTPWNYGQTLPGQLPWTAYLPSQARTQNMPAQNMPIPNIMNMPPQSDIQSRQFHPNQTAQQQGWPGLSMPMPHRPHPTVPHPNVMGQTTSAPGTPGQAFPPGSFVPQHARAQSMPVQNFPAQSRFGWNNPNDYPTYPGQPGPSGPPGPQPPYRT